MCHCQSVIVIWLAVCPVEKQAFIFASLNEVTEAHAALSSLH